MSLFSQRNTGSANGGGTPSPSRDFVAKPINLPTESSGNLDANRVIENDSKKFITTTEKQKISSIEQRVNNADSRIDGLQDEIGLKANLDTSNKVPISELPDSLKDIRVVDDIPMRNTLSTYDGLTVYVVDSFDDTGVHEEAEYIYQGSNSTWRKKNLSLNVVLDWANLQGTPSSSVLNIDDAVDKKHFHSNGAILDNTSESFTTEYKEKIDNFNSVEHFKGVFDNSSARNSTITSPENGDYVKQKDTNSFWFFGDGGWTDSGKTPVLPYLLMVAPTSGTNSNLANLDWTVVKGLVPKQSKGITYNASSGEISVSENGIYQVSATFRYKLNNINLVRSRFGFDAFNNISVDGTRFMTPYVYTFENSAGSSIWGHDVSTSVMLEANKTYNFETFVEYSTNGSNPRIEFDPGYNSHFSITKITSL